MAISTETIRKITIQGSTQGVNEATDALNRFAVAQGNVAVVSDTSAKRALSAEQAYNRQTLSVVAGAREQANYEKAVKTAKAALDQGIISHSDYAARVDLLKDKFGQAGVGAKAFAAATTGVSSQLIALSAGAGPVGVFLSALGPWGLAAAVGVGAAEQSLSAMSSAAHDLAQKSQQLRDFSEATGLTTAQVQALRSEASKFGVDSDTAQNAIQNFTARFNDLRIGQGELLTQVRRLNPALADQMASVTNAGDALTLFGHALENVDNVFQRNSLVKAATGRGGISAAQFLSGLDVNKVTQGYIDAGKALDDGLIRKLAQLEIDITKTSNKARENIASIFAEPVLEGQKQFAKLFLDISEGAKNFKVSGDWSTFIEGLRIAQRNAMVGLLPGLAKVDPFAKGAQSFDESGMLGLSAAAGVPLPRSRPPEANPEYVANKLKDQISAMGDAATAAMKLDLAQKQLAISGASAGLSSIQLARASALLNETFANQRLQANVAAMGSAATVSEQYQLRVSALKLELDKGAISQQAYNRGLAGMEMESAIRAQSDYISALGPAATETDQYRLRLLQLQQQLEQGRISQEDFNTAVIAAVPAFGQMKGALEGSLNTFISNLASGKSIMDSLIASAGQLGQAMTSIGTKSLGDSLSKGLAGGGFAFDPVSLGIGAAGMALSFITGAAQQSKQRAADMQAAANRASQYNTTAQLAGIDTTTLSGALQAFDVQAVQTRLQEAQQKFPQMAALEAQLAAQRLAIYKQFNDAVLAQAKEIRDYAESLKIGDLSTLSPQEKLAAAQAAYNADYAKAQAGDHDAPGRLTAEADTLLQAAKAFFASSSGYAAVFDQVYGQLSQFQGVQYSAPGMAAGGLVGNGIFGVDSVRASFAGGGDIMLAGGEFVNRAQSVNSSTFPTLDHINRTGSLPSNDNAKHFDNLARVIAQGFNGQTEVQSNDIAALRAEVAELRRTIKAQGDRAPRPGGKQTQKGA